MLGASGVRTESSGFSGSENVLNCAMGLSTMVDLIEILARVSTTFSCVSCVVKS